MDTIAPFIIFENQFMNLNGIREEFTKIDGSSVYFSDDGLNSDQSSPPANSAIIVWHTDDRPTEFDLEQLRNLAPFIRLIIVLGRTSPVSLQDAYAAGVRGCLMVDMTLREAKQALHTVMSGGIYLPTDYKGLEVPSRGFPDASTLADQLLDLTPAQRRVLDLLCRGYANKEIARALNISVGTAKNHVTAILGVLKMQTRQQLIVKFGQASI